MRASHGSLLAARFWGHVRVVPDACWEWTAARNLHGYGRITVQQRNLAAHRVSWELAFGPIPDGAHVLHHCDNPPCVRPDHLFLGTPQTNYDDARSKGRTVPPPRPTAELQAVIRHPRGDDHWSRKHPELVRRGANAHRAKLTEDQVRDIRRLSAEGWTLVRLSAAFGVRVSTVSYIVRRETWRHLT